RSTDLRFGRGEAGRRQAIPPGSPPPPPILPRKGRGIAYGATGDEFVLGRDPLERQFSEGAAAIPCLESYFGAVPDPRAPNATHRLGDLIVMMIAASLCGASNATEFALFAQERKPALSRLIAYDAVPSHDTFSRLL